METVQGLLAVAISTALVISIIALIKPIPKLHLATRGRAAVALVGSFAMMVVYGHALSESEPAQESPRTIQVSEPAESAPKETDLGIFDIRRIVFIDANKLHTEYSTNGIVADQKFKGKRARVDGDIIKIYKDSKGNGVVDLGTTGSQEGLPIHCNFGKTSLYELRKLVAGQSVRIEGTIIGFVEDRVFLNECVLDYKFVDL